MFGASTETEQSVSKNINVRNNSVDVVHNKYFKSCKRVFTEIFCKKSKFLYNAASSPQEHSKRFSLYFPDRPVHSDTISASLGSVQPYATINARRLLVHISTTIYSQVLIYSAE